MSVRFAGFLLTFAQAAFAQDVLIIGEVHDNPAHHMVQASKVAKLQPAALVFEMLAPDQAAGVTPELLADQAALESALQWDQGGWPDFAMYYPIFAAAPEARIYGALVPRDVARQVFETGLEQVFGVEADRYGLSVALPSAQQSAREALQMEVHCNALPPEILPGMVEIQRLRDAVLARAVVQALDETGGPVAVITGNGHARRDWGVPSYLAHVVPEVDIFVIGQTEEDHPLDGGYDRVLSAAAPERADPCAAFQ